MERSRGANRIARAGGAVQQVDRQGAPYAAFPRRWTIERPPSGAQKGNGGRRGDRPFRETSFPSEVQRQMCAAEMIPEAICRAFVPSGRVGASQPLIAFLEATIQIVRVMKM